MRVCTCCGREGKDQRSENETRSIQETQRPLEYARTCRDRLAKPDTALFDSEKRVWCILVLECCLPCRPSKIDLTIRISTSHLSAFKRYCTSSDRRPTHQRTHLTSEKINQVSPVILLDLGFHPQSIVLITLQKQSSQ